MSSAAGTVARTWAYLGGGQSGQLASFKGTGSFEATGRTHGELSGGSSSNDLESSSSMSSALSSSLDIRSEDAGVSCVTGLSGTASPVAKEYFESAPMPTSEVADEGRRLCPSEYQPLLFRLPEECDRFGLGWLLEGPSAQLSRRTRCDRGTPRALLRRARSTSSSGSESSCGMRTAPYEEAPRAGDDRMSGARDMKARTR